MSYQLLPFLYLHVTLINAAPLLLLPNSWTAQTPQQVLQKQLMELQALQHLNAQSPFQMNNQLQPLVVVFPNDQPNTKVKSNQHFKLHNDKSTTHTNLDNDEDLNSIVIDAAPEENSNQNQNQVITIPQRAILLLPNGRLSIGGVISAIPFLPIEINVPDTISWAYNGIASGIGSIISIIGRPFQGATQEVQIPETDPQSLLKQILTRRQNVGKPMIMMPIDGPVLPIQV